MNEEIFTGIISPAGIPRIPDEALKPRPETLKGMVLRVLENNKGILRLGAGQGARQASDGF